ncbi:MAG TPA: CvpA family protein [bacterium]|nr:CvpA family protein [bacterium]
MNTIDITILVIIGFFAVKGLFKGVFLETFTLMGLLLGCVLALRGMGVPASFIQRIIAMPNLLASTLGFILILMGVVVLFRILGGIIKKLAHWSLLGWIDRAGGFIIGFFKGTLVASLLILLISLIPMSEELAAEQRNSLLYSPVKTVAPAVFNMVKRVVPRTKEFMEEIRETLDDTGRELGEQVLKEELESAQRGLKNRER